MSLVRRRIKSPLLRFELFSVTDTSHVDVILAYMADRVPMKLVKKIRKKLEDMPLETILGSGYVEPFLCLLAAEYPVKKRMPKPLTVAWTTSPPMAVMIFCTPMGIPI